MTEKQKRTLAAVLMIGVAIILQIVSFLFGSFGIPGKLMNAALIVGLVAGLLYIRAGYRKPAAIYYKTFMILYAVEAVYNVAFRVITMLETKSAQAHFVTVLNVIGAVIFFLSALCVILLAVVQNLHKGPSLFIGGTNMVLVFVFTLVEIIALHNFTTYYAVYIGGVILAIVAYLFVTDKYADKDARGTT